MMTATLTAPAWIALAAALVPLALAMLVALPHTRASAARLLPLAALPALAVSAFVADGESTVTWLVTGMTIVIDPTTRAFLALSAAVWTAAAIYSSATAPGGRHATQPRFRFFFLLAMAGSLGLTVTVDPAGFYSFFALMALPTYALVAAGSGQNSRRAGRVYMAYTVVGEALLVCGLFITGAAAFGFAMPAWATPAGVALLLAAFGIKIGTLGLHGWMPVSYAAASPAAAAALSGAMSKAGILGLIRFLPGGEPDAITFGALVMVFGVASAFFGVAAGVFQTDPKAVLAYSSVSQLGLITIAIGAGLAVPAAWPYAVAAATAYAVHHGLAKAALFLGEDIANRSARRAFPLIGLALPAVALAGFPFTSGAVAKVALKEATGLAPGVWQGALEVLLPLGAVGTTLLMARFLVLVATRPPRPAEAGRSTPCPLAVAAWSALLAAVATTFWIWPAEEIRYVAAKSLSEYYLVLAAWPVAVGVVVAGIVWFARATTVRFAGAIPPADIFGPLFNRAHLFVESWGTTIAALSTCRAKASYVHLAKQARAVGARLLECVGRVESGLLAWAHVHLAEQSRALGTRVLERVGTVESGILVWAMAATFIGMFLAVLLLLSALG